MDEYDMLVESASETSSACPTQWIGTLRDGRAFYFRYRWGCASLGIGATVDDAVCGQNIATERIGDDLDGVMSIDEYQETFVRLYNKLDRG